MIASLRNLLSRTPKRPLPKIPPGERVYAIGDIHGRFDLLTALLARIDSDEAQRPPARTTIVLLGDLVDRGPDSARVVAAVRQERERRGIRVLCGNHEEMFVRAFVDETVIDPFLHFGGFETLVSYGVDGDALSRADPPQAQALMRAAVPDRDLDFLNALEDNVVVGDYLFVHAGIRPGIPIGGQNAQDMRWIREPFLSDPRDHERFVVHGHTIVDEPEMRGNRIGIDTGAYMTGRLTALGLEGTARWLLQTGADTCIDATPAAQA